MSRDSIEVMRLAAALPLIEALPDDTKFLSAAEKARVVWDTRSSPKKDKFRSAAEETPFLLRSLGLGAGLSTLAAKEGERGRLAAMIAAWLLHGCPHSPWHRNAGSTDVAAALACIAATSRNEYRAAQIEAIGYATSIKRLAQALCPKEAS